MSEEVVGNLYDKYHTKNPLARMLMSGFITSYVQLLNKIQVRSVLEAGCGEAELANIVAQKLKNLDKLKGVDIDSRVLQIAQKRFPALDLAQASIYDLPFEDDSFELVISCEVLEHLENPERGLEEITRVSSKYVLLSVPREPIWRICNMARGKYLADFGNTPTHIQHWSKKRFLSFVQSRIHIIQTESPFPWTMVLGKVKKGSRA